jgi:hypothetical protein
VPARLRTALLHDVAAFADLDPHAAERGSYLVRSLYLDTPNWQAWHDKDAGLAHRHKQRVRTYLPDEDAAVGAVKFEIKIRGNDRIRKHVVAVPAALHEQLRPSLQGHRLPSLGDLARWTSLHEFYRLKQLHARRGRIVVQYRRVAFRDRAQPSVRITFDDDLRAALASDLAQHPRRLTPCGPAQLGVLEIKVQDSLPRWLHVVIRRYRLRPQPLSKYHLAVGAKVLLPSVGAMTP